jgi:hypothetical protein
MNEPRTHGDMSEQRGKFNLQFWSYLPRKHEDHLKISTVHRHLNLAPLLP